MKTLNEELKSLTSHELYSLTQDIEKENGALKNFTPYELYSLAYDIEREMESRLVKLLKDGVELKALTNIVRISPDLCEKYDDIVEERLDHIELNDLDVDSPIPVLFWQAQTYDGIDIEEKDKERVEVFDIKHMLYVYRILNDLELTQKYNDQIKKCEEGLDFDHEDIVITDPCYFHVDAKPEKMIQRDTIYGDWSCSVFAEYDEPGIIGEFCADSGMVCVAVLKDVLKINPEFENWAKEHDWCAAIIRNYTGHVAIVEKEECGEACVIVEGKGPELNFTTAQTGL